MPGFFCANFVNFSIFSIWQWTIKQVAQHPSERFTGHGNVLSVFTVTPMNLDIQNLDRLAQAHPGKTFPSIRKLAAAAGVNHCTLHRWFKRAKGQSALWLVEDQRIKTAHPKPYIGGARGMFRLTSLAIDPAVPFKPIIDANRKRLAQGNAGEFGEMEADWVGIRAFDRFRYGLYLAIDAEDPSTKPRGWMVN